jgi:hypothetical protein
MPTKVRRVGFLDQLLADARLRDDLPAAEAVAGYEEHQHTWFSGLLGPLVLPDRRLAEVGRVAAPRVVPVSVLNTGGAGGLIALAGRETPGLEVVAVESALRDLDDLAGNAARVAAAAQELGDEVTVFVEIPYGPGWIAAAEEVEAAGLLGKIDAGNPPGADRLAERLSVLVETDLPVKVSGLERPGASTGDSAAGRLAGLLLGLDALIDGATTEEAADLLRLDDPVRLTAGLANLDAPARSRIRRRLRSVDAVSMSTMATGLRSLGLTPELG